MKRARARRLLAVLGLVSVGAAFALHAALYADETIDQPNIPIVNPDVMDYDPFVERDSTRTEQDASVAVDAAPMTEPSDVAATEKRSADLQQPSDHAVAGPLVRPAPGPIQPPRVTASQTSANRNSVSQALPSQVPPGQILPRQSDLTRLPPTGLSSDWQDPNRFIKRQPSGPVNAVDSPRREPVLSSSRRNAHSTQSLSVPAGSITTTAPWQSQRPGLAATPGPFQLGSAGRIPSGPMALGLAPTRSIPSITESSTGASQVAWNPSVAPLSQDNTSGPVQLVPLQPRTVDNAAPVARAASPLPIQQPSQRTPEQTSQAAGEEDNTPSNPVSSNSPSSLLPQSATDRLSQSLQNSRGTNSALLDASPQHASTANFQTQSQSSSRRQHVIERESTFLSHTSAEMPTTELNVNAPATVVDDDRSGASTPGTDPISPAPAFPAPSTSQFRESNVGEVRRDSPLDGSFDLAKESEYYPTREGRSLLQEGDYAPMPAEEDVLMEPGQFIGEPTWSADNAVCPPSALGFATSGPKVYVKADWVYYRPEMGTYQISNIVATDHELFRQGARATIGYRSDATFGWEFTAMQLESALDISDSALLPALPSLTTRWVPAFGILPANISSFNGAQRHIQTQDLDITNIEINRITWGWDVYNSILGLRILHFQENTFLGAGPLNVPIATLPGQFFQSLDNTLIGPQVGISLIDNSWFNLTLDSQFKAGVFLNLIDQETILVNNGALQFANQDDAVKIALNGEASVGLSLQLTQNLKVRAGFDAAYFYGLATAQEQIRSAPQPNFGGALLTPATGLRTTNETDILMWGATVGLYWNWP